MGNYNYNLTSTIVNMYLLDIFSVKKMKTEFATPKDLEKLRVELASKAVGGKLDPTHPDMGPIMDSLIMTSITSSSSRDARTYSYLPTFQMTGLTLTVEQPLP